MKSGDYVIFFVYTFMMLYVCVDLFFLKQKIKYYIHKKFGKDGSFFGIILPFLILSTLIAIFLNNREVYDSIP
jgi:hypothetical protein